MLTVIMGDYFNVFTMFANISMMYPILVYSTVGLYSHSYGVCIKACMAVNREDFRQMRNQWRVIMHVI